MLLQGKTAVVTGGTRGIGYAIVRHFLNEGANVALCGSTEKTTTAAVEKIKAEMPHANVIGIWPDLTCEESVAASFQQVVEHFGDIDILANNAGISQSTPLCDYTPDDIDKVLNLNVKAVIECCQAFARYKKSTARGGVIINTSSAVSIYGQASGVGYPASKFAVNGITKSLSRELASYGIRVNAVAPGVIRTNMVAALPEQMIKPILDKIPLGRMGEADDIAHAFVFLASDHASYITGAILQVDGGVMI